MYTNLTQMVTGTETQTAACMSLSANTALMHLTRACDANLRGPQDLG